MTIQSPAQKVVELIPETAPFTPDQRSWLNGFVAGLLTVDFKPSIQPAPGMPDAAARALGGAEDGAPWHDPAMAIADRMALAESRPKPHKLFAAMAQQNCGQCGYLCESYADKIASGEEKRLNLCVPGGKDTSRMLRVLMEDGPVVAPQINATPETQSAPLTTPIVQSGYSRESLVTAVFKSAVRLNGESSEKDTRHVVLDISNSGITYEPGDSFGILPKNHPSLVDAVLEAMKAPGDFPVGGKSLRQALIEDYALGLAPDMLFELVSYLVGGARRQKAKALAKGQDPDGDAASYDVLKVLQTFEPIHPDPEAFLESLEPLQPRLYSISSSPLATPAELHLTVDCVRYEVEGRQRLGVASTFLSDRLTTGSEVSVYVQKSHGFRLPTDPTIPVIMVGPGTGIAPFRSFLHQRATQNATGNAWLFFGHQREATDFFYRDDFESFLNSGTLGKLSTAWSRDGNQKVYVQDRMRESGAELWSWLKAGAHFYVCGDAKQMAKDVEKAIADIAEKHGHLSPAAAGAFVSELKVAGRYLADVY